MKTPAKNIRVLTSEAVAEGTVAAFRGCNPIGVFPLETAGVPMAPLAADAVALNPEDRDRLLAAGVLETA